MLSAATRVSRLTTPMTVAGLVGIACSACGAVPPAPDSGLVSDSGLSLDARPGLDGGILPDTGPPPDTGPGGRPMCNGGSVSVLENGNFDALDPPWRQEPSNSGLLCGDLITPHTRPLAACLGRMAVMSSNAVSREVQLPVGAVSAQLTGQICIATEEVEALDNDILTIELLDGATPIATLLRRTNQQGRADCAFASFAVQVALLDDPEVATFRMKADLDNGKSTSFYIDTLTLTITCR